MDTIVVWFSCGAASAVAAKKTLEKYGSTHKVRVVNNPIANEDQDNKRFLKDVESWLGVEIETAVNNKYPNADIVEVFDKASYMSGVRGAPCTTTLKRRARQQWEMFNDHHYLVFGFTVEELGRHERLAEQELVTVIPVLIDLNLSKENCFQILTDANIALPRMYHLGYPNANCVGCVKATSPTYWNLVRQTHPEVFQERLEQSERLNVRLVRVKGKRIKLSELSVNDKGRKLRSIKMPDCGVLCELE